MLLTKKIIKLNQIFISIPSATKGIFDLSENRWGYKVLKK
tara:strand:- start:42 stop:161 length:120 start_codon:yes stop_codon:yes gene_type:complete